MITSRMPRPEYDAIDALNISRLKEIKRSPQHYQWALANPRRSDALTLGIATHVATLEPERYEMDFVVWDRVTDAGAMAPRRGQYWDAFIKGCNGRTILTPEESRIANTIAKAVRGNPLAMRYLESGDPEVTINWQLDEALGGRAAKSRVDWLTTIDGEPYLVGFKTARDCRHFAFGAQSAKLAYHWQWAFYFDAYVATRGVKPKLVEIVAESAAPHAVAVYRIADDIIEQGREEYWQAAKLLAECERTNEWPGPQPVEEFLSLPSWAYPGQDDLDDIGLEAA
jgi:hypothetical protein